MYDFIHVNVLLDTMDYIKHILTSPLLPFFFFYLISLTTFTPASKYIFSLMKHQLEQSTDNRNKSLKGNS